jgi:hypothetical protein
MPMLFLYLDPVALANGEPTLARFLDEAKPAHHAALEKAHDAGALLYPIPKGMEGKSLDYYAGYLQARVDEHLGDDLNYRTYVVRNPFGEDGTGKEAAFQVAVVPGGVTHYRVMSNGGEGINEQVYTFEQALGMAWAHMSNPDTVDVEIVAVDEYGEALGDEYTVYEQA